MTTSPRLRVYRRGLDGPGEELGEARLLWPGVAQVLPPLDAELARTPHHAEDLVVVPDSGDAENSTTAPPDTGSIDVLRIRPSLIGYEDAERLSADNGAAGMLARTSGWMVALELGTVTPRGPDGPGHAPWPPGKHDPTCGWGDAHPGPCRTAGDPWWCNIFCVRSSCDHC